MVNEENLDEGLYIDYAASGDALYNQYNQLLSASALSAGSNYAVYTGTIKEFEHRVESSSEQERKATVSTEDVNFISKNTQGLESLFNEVSFRDFLMVGYEGKCAITRTAINFGGMVNLEAAHIHPKAHGGNFLPSNGLMLCRDLHWAFDHGFLALTDDCHVMVSRKAPSDMLSPLDGKPIFMPADNFIKPNVDSIRWHRQNVFEHFGSIRAK